jgi:hypothetical protein
MHKSLFVIIGIPLLLFGSIGNAQPQGITMDMINTTLDPCAAIETSVS